MINDQHSDADSSPLVSDRLRLLGTFQLVHRGQPIILDQPNTACAQLRRVATSDDPEHRTQFWQLDDHRFFQKIALMGTPN